MGQLTEIIETKYGSVIVSTLLGLGIAALFRRVCEDKQCIVVKSPDYEDIERYYYKVNDECYKYKQMESACSK